MLIENVLLYGEDCRFHPGALAWEGERITAAAASGEVLDGEGCFLIPGLIDLHFHGCMGHDFCEGTPEALALIARYEARHGITGLCPATMTLPEAALLQIARSAKAFAESCPADCARLYGLHLEGPFLAEAKKGAQNAAFLQKPNQALFHALQAASGGLVKILSLAPELTGALPFIEEMRGEVTLSLAHTAADYETARRALCCGVTHVTHLYNAMTPFSHRSPGVVGAVWEDESCRAELICDGIHVHPATVRLTMKLLGDDRVIFISDSMEGTGMTDGAYTLGGQDVAVRGALATLRDGTIAGSCTNLMDCLRTAVLEMGVPLESAVKCATRNPARELHIDALCGSLAPGKRADFVLLEKESLRVRAVYLGGRALSEPLTKRSVNPH